VSWTIAFMALSLLADCSTGRTGRPAGLTLYAYDVS
jgi:hypothetical protein